MNRAPASLILGLLLTASCTAGADPPRDPPALSPGRQVELGAWLEKHGETPERYVVGLFADHDVVFLGEQHRVKHDPLLVQALLPKVYEAGVHVLGYEFGRREDQPLIDSLLAMKEWDEDLAREIVFRQFMAWGYREYVDIYKAAWALNQRLPEGAPRFRVLGLNDSPDWSLIRTRPDQENPEVMRRVWRGGGEDLWAEPIVRAVRSGEKVLAYCGIHHAFTKYRQPMVADGKFVRFGDVRCGNHVRDALGDRVATVYLHAPWNGFEGYDSPMRHPTDGIIDALMLAVGLRPVGFDVSGGPFGELRVKDAVYRHGYEDFKLADFCDGWIYTKPISEFEGVTPIPDWVNGRNLDRARQQSPNPASRKDSAGRINRGIARDAEIPRRWGHLR
jgi:Haem-binding uptake, Tiki superfamily, ChaN